MIKKVWLTVFLSAFAAVWIGASAAIAAPFEFSPTAKNAFDKMAASTDESTAKKLNKAYTELKSLQKQELDLDAATNTLRYANEEAELAVRKRIKEIGQREIKAAEAALNAAKKQHQPLFDLYEAQKKQLSAAKKLKNKSLTEYWNWQVDLTKMAVQLAKDDIRRKETALKNVKAKATADMKKIRDILAANDATKVKLKSARSAVSTTRKLFTAESKVLLQAVRKGEPFAALSSFNGMLVYQKQILKDKSSMLALEQKIKNVIGQAESAIHRL